MAFDSNWMIFYLDSETVKQHCVFQSVNGPHVNHYQAALTKTVFNTESKKSYQYQGCV